MMTQMTEIKFAGDELQQVELQLEPGWAWLITPQGILPIELIPLWNVHMEAALTEFKSIVLIDCCRECGPRFQDGWRLESFNQQQPSSQTSWIKTWRQLQIRSLPNQLKIWS